MAVAPYADGFLLSEVNLGMGYLDIEEMVRVIRREQPEIRFNLEMITRDPLLVPCLTPQYWETQPKVTAGELAHYMEGIRNMKRMPLPVISDFPQDEQLRLEVENNRTCLNTAQARYGFA